MKVTTHDLRGTRKQQVRAYAEYLFQSLELVKEKGPEIDWTIEVRPFFKNNKTPDTKLRKWFSGEGEFVDHITKIWDLERHIYAGINPRAGEVGTQGGTPYVVNVLVDLDSKNGYSKEDRLAQVEKFPLDPALVIESSNNNLQAVYGFTHPQEATKVRPIVERLQQMFVTDKVADSNRLMRVPGTCNAKEAYETPQRARLLSVEGKRHSALEMSSHLPVLENSRDTEAGSVYKATEEKIFCSGEARNTTIFTQSRSLAARGSDKDHGSNEQAEREIPRTCGVETQG